MLLLCQIYLKLRIKTPELCLLLLLLTLNIFSTSFYCYYWWIWKDKYWLSLRTIVSENKFVFSNCEKYIVLWNGKNCWGYTFSFLLSQHKVVRRYIFSTPLQKGKYMTRPSLTSCPSLDWSHFMWNSSYKFMKMNYKFLSHLWEIFSWFPLNGRTK